MKWDLDARGLCRECWAGPWPCHKRWLRAAPGDSWGGSRARAPKWCITARSASVDPVRPEVVVWLHESVASLQWPVGFAAVSF